MEQATEKQISNTLELINEVLGDGALGVYVYGSYTLGGLQKSSDIDLLVVSKRPTSRRDKEVLVKKMLAISGDYRLGTSRSVELTIVVHSEIHPWKYPPKLDFQYGDWMRDDFKKGNIEPRDTNIEEDLAISITQVLLTGKALKGPSPEQLLPAVPYKDFMEATAGEIDDLMAELEPDTRNVLLTLTRIWAILATDTISAKQDAAAWAITKLPQKYKSIIEHARLVSLGQADEDWTQTKDLVKPCANYIVDEIQRLHESLDFGQPNKRVKVFSAQ